VGVHVHVACRECSRRRKTCHVFALLSASKPLLLTRSHLIDASAPPGAKVLGILYAVSPAPESGELDHLVHGVVFGVPALLGGEIVVPDLLFEGVVDV
jgi:hypothetical protein